MTEALSFRQGFFGDPQAWAAFAGLLQDIFELDITPIGRQGGPDPQCMPFAYFDPSGACVANVSAFSMPVMIEGRHVLAAGIQSVAVRPQWRGKGLYRDLLKRALGWCDQQGCELVGLYTDNPALYHSHGFQVVPEHLFVGAPPLPMEDSQASRRLSPGCAEDVSLIRELLATRTPVSLQTGLVDQGTMFLLNVALDTDLDLAYLEEAEAVVVFQQDGDGSFRLVDVVASAIPSLATILAGLRMRPSRVEVCFPTDRLDWTGTATPANQGISLMFKGELPPALHQPFMLPPTAAF